MNVNDPISDMLTRIRNANTVGKAEVAMPSTKVLVEIARVLQEEGYVEGYVVNDTKPQKTLVITLKYGPKRARTIKGIKRISKPRHCRDLHLPWHDVRPRRPQGRRRRRDHRLRVVTRQD